MSKKRSAKLQLCVSMIIFGTIGLFSRSVNVSSGELALYRALMAAILLTGFFVVTKRKLDIKAIKKEFWPLLFSGIAMGVNWIFLFEAYKHTTISVATLSYYFAPVLVTILCPILFKEKLTVKQVLCFVMSTIGLVLIILFEESDAGVSDAVSTGGHLLGICFGLAAACFYATVILLNKRIKEVEGIQRTYVQFLAAIVILVPYVACTSGVQLGGLDSIGWVCLVIVGVVHTGITYCMYFSSLKELKGQEISILSYLDPLVAVLASVFILGEKMGLMQLIGGIMILGFTLWNELGEQKESEIET